jgi:hypothetical protein
MEYVARFFTAHNLEAIGYCLALLYLVNSANRHLWNPARIRNGRLIRRASR